MKRSHRPVTQPCPATPRRCFPRSWPLRRKTPLARPQGVIPPTLRSKASLTRHGAFADGPENMGRLRSRDSADTNADRAIREWFAAPQHPDQRTIRSKCQGPASWRQHRTSIPRWSVRVRQHTRHRSAIRRVEGHQAIAGIRHEPGGGFQAHRAPGGRRKVWVMLYPRRASSGIGRTKANQGHSYPVAAKEGALPIAPVAPRPRSFFRHANAIWPESIPRPANVARDSPSVEQGQSPHIDRRPGQTVRPIPHCAIQPLRWLPASRAPVPVQRPVQCKHSSIGC